MNKIGKQIGETFSCVYSRALLEPHIHTWSRSSLEGNNTERKTGSGVCFPSFTPPLRPLHPFSTAIALYAFSPLTRIVLSAEVKALDILMLLFKQATTFPRAHFRDTMKYIFLLFLVTAARWFVAAVIKPLAGNLGRVFFFFFFFLPFSQTMTLALMLNPPLSQTLTPPPWSLSSVQTSPQFLPGGVGGTRHCTETGCI